MIPNPDKCSRSQCSGDPAREVVAMRKSRFAGELKIEYLWMLLRSPFLNLKPYFLLKIETKAVSALFETSSRGEQPLFQAIYIVAAKRNVVIKRFGQAFNSHWPVHMSFHLFEKGNK